MEYIVEYVLFVNVDRCQVKIDIGNRLMQYRKRNNIKMPEIAQATGIKLNTLYKWEKGTRPKDFVQQLVLNDYLDKKENDADKYMMNDERGVYVGPPGIIRIRIPVTGNQQPSNKTNHHFAWSFNSILDAGEPFLFGGYKHAPRLDQEDYVLTVVGESMCPTFESGSKIIIKKIERPVLLIWGAPYFIIDTNKQGVLRRVLPGKTADKIVLAADNPNKQLFPDIIRGYNQITAILQVELYQAMD
jgi:transcriptional regulator with XRE-family HTH domain